MTSEPTIFSPSAKRSAGLFMDPRRLSPDVHDGKDFYRHLPMPNRNPIRDLWALGLGHPQNESPQIICIKIRSSTVTSSSKTAPKRRRLFRKNAPNKHSWRVLIAAHLHRADGRGADAVITPQTEAKGASGHRRRAARVSSRARGKFA